MSKPLNTVGARKPGGPRHAFAEHADPGLRDRGICAECGKARADKSHMADGDRIDGYCGFCGREGHKAKDCDALDHVHNHLTRDVKPRGQCKACDRHHDAELERAWAEKKPMCNFFWGSHGCSLPADWPHRVHLCSSYEWALDEDDEDVKTLAHCCEYDEDRPAGARVRWSDDDGGWSEWREYGEGWRQ